MYSNTPYTLVMIEDDEGHATLIRKHLQRSGIHNPTVYLKNGAEAVDYFFGPTPPTAQRMLVLLDLNLPEIDGYEILRRLRSEQHTRMIPVIVLTTTDNPKEIQRCYELGCNVYITKPVEYDHFTDAIHKLSLMLAVIKVPLGMK